MNSHELFDQIVGETIEQIRILSKVKGGEYAGDDDRLANFRRNAKNAGVEMETCWAIYAGKHWDSITQYVQDLQTGKVRERSEPMAGRADDLIVYLLLFKQMLREREMNAAADIVPGDEDPQCAFSFGKGPVDEGMRPLEYGPDGEIPMEVSDRAMDAIRRMFGADFRDNGPEASDAAAREFVESVTGAASSVPQPVYDASMFIADRLEDISAEVKEMFGVDATITDAEVAFRPISR